ncbi:winged helix-turn-helix transcriptional regulator [Variovorax sp. Root411]|uniref:winged helix-turn-helix transcriptional regulator n=1 Tax=Variovorax sp. Root411 TaxID=1736530 RepID=UPI0009E8B7C2|nr:helix-turn-helix domain-containing protein [Variovorax sp. Root411]
MKNTTVTLPTPTDTLADKMHRGEWMSVDCPGRAVLRHLTSRWGVLLLIALQDGTQRFSDLRRKVKGVSERMLAQTLQQLECDGMLMRTEYRVVPPHVEYSLTDLGCQAAHRVRSLADWVEGVMPQIEQYRTSNDGPGSNQ